MLDRAHAIVTVNHAEEPQYHVTTERILKIEKSKDDVTT
ncbi:hypothetical protein DSM3645_22466 [Blastopirellula marina DSM 3645]|uniref:Uncharacterized protein n=1 Tax=Blastopirellula marina DSM 3645 TaxID=314230 RepID=A3ZPT0_9BACT|nr:hypothetical protein DSM3645_22466 [Blastopirellula marina DSM 3645]